MDIQLFSIRKANYGGETLLGENQKGLLLITESQGKEEELQSFLGKILGAVKFELQKDAYLLPLNPEENIHFDQLRKDLDISHVISFGIPPHQLGLNFRPAKYQPLTLGKFTFLFADPLTKIFEERQKGGKQMAGSLWQALKTLFLP